jgi:Carboxypeptidase regulatory-like domain
MKTSQPMLEADRKLITREIEDSVPLEMRLLSDRALLCVVRSAVNRPAALFWFFGTDCRSTTRAVDEALTNIVRHSYHGRPDQLHPQDHKPEDNQTRNTGHCVPFRCSARARSVEKMFFVLLAFCCLQPFTTNAQTSPSTGTVRGTLFLLGSDGPAYVPGGTVVLTGLETQKTETDQEGRYSFEAVPSGTYRIEAVASGLQAEQTITVEADKTTDTDLELKPTEVKSTVTVTVNASEARVPAPSETISEQTLRDAPNMNERFESALPTDSTRCRNFRRPVACPLPSSG